MSELKWVKTTFGELKAGDVATKEEQGAKDFVAYWNKKDVCYIYGWAYFVRTPFPCDESDRNTPVYKIVFPSPEREALEKIRGLACSGTIPTDEFIDGQLSYIRAEDMLKTARNRWRMARDCAAIATAALSLIGGSDETK